MADRRDKAEWDPSAAIRLPPLFRTFEDRLLGRMPQEPTDDELRGLEVYSREFGPKAGTHQG